MDPDRHRFRPSFVVSLLLAAAACSSQTSAPASGDGAIPTGTGGAGPAPADASTPDGSAGGANGGGGVTSTGGASGAAGARATGGASGTGGGTGRGGATRAPDASAGKSGTGGKAAGGTTASGGGRATGGNSSTAGSSGTGGKAAGGATATGGAKGSGGASGTGGRGGTGGASSTGGRSGTGGGSGSGGSTAGEAWPNIRVVNNHLCDRWGKPFALRGIESMFGNGTSNAEAFVAGHKALGANAVGPLPNSSVTSAASIEALLAAAYAAGLVVGLNADHTNQGERFFQSTQIQAIVNRYPNVYLQEAVELGSDMTESEWVAAAKAKVDAYVALYPDKPLKVGSPMGGRSPRFALDRCQDVVDYYYAKGGRGGLIFTCQLYWKASNASWSYQEENGFRDGLPGILQAIDAMAASPCMFMPGLDNEDDIGYTGWREVMDHVRESSSDPGKRLSYQWWVYYNSGDPYDNDLTTDASDALAGITSTGRDVKAKLELDRQYVELGPMNP